MRFGLGKGETLIAGSAFWSFGGVSYGRSFPRGAENGTRGACGPPQG